MPAENTVGVLVVAVETFGGTVGGGEGVDDFLAVGFGFVGGVCGVLVIVAEVRVRVVLGLERLALWPAMTRDWSDMMLLFEVRCLI